MDTPSHVSSVACSLDSLLCRYWVAFPLIRKQVWQANDDASIWRKDRRKNLLTDQLTDRLSKEWTEKAPLQFIFDQNSPIFGNFSTMGKDGWTDGRTKLLIEMHNLGFPCGIGIRIKTHFDPLGSSWVETVIHKLMRKCCSSKDHCPD